MSLILDAINKSEREKDSSEAVPDLQTIHSREEPPSNNSHKTWMIIIGALLVSLLIVLLVLLVTLLKSPSQSGESESPPSTQSQRESAQEKTQKTAGNITQANQQPSSPKGDSDAPSKAGSEPPVTAKEGKPPSEEVAALYGDAQEAQPLVIEPTAEPATVIQPSQNSVDEELARQLWQETQRLMPTRRVASNREESEPAESKEPPAALTAPFDETMAAYEGTPFLHELSVSVQDSIPTLMYALHKYDEQRVVINKKNYRQGDDLGSGVVIESILADGLILNFNSYQFKLAALNSWVNY